MKIVFMGSAELACPSLRSLCDNPEFEVAAVVTQPAKPRGRNRRTALCAAGEEAIRGGVTLLTPSSVNSAESVSTLRSLAPEAIVVVAYGQILKPPVLGVPPMGCVNVHASLLPRYRGAAPIQWSIANGETETGVTTMLMNERMDDGDILLQERAAIAADETASQLHDRLARLGAALLIRTLRELRAGKLKPRPQDRSMATLAPRLRKEDGRIIWTRPVADTYNRVRAFDPWPGSYCVVPAGEGPAYRLAVLRCRAETRSGAPGRVLDTGADGPLVGAGGASLRLLEVQPEGRHSMDGASFLRGHRLAEGDMLG
jgi:methionyl-tRNA formyltransferase